MAGGRVHASVTALSKRPILVTGVPRSGTTWLARWLATTVGTVLAGREPMNPREHQYALGHTLDGWTSLGEPTSRQRRALRSAYAGLNPWVYSRYGRRQWAGPLPQTRKVVKDPFALLSLAPVVEVTGAVPLLVYRHPGAVLVSYRRMGWEPDLQELQRVIVELRATRAVELEDLPGPGETSPAEAMGRFWSTLHEIALLDAPRLPDLTVVSHERLARGGEVAGRLLLERLGFRWTPKATAELSRRGDAAGARRASVEALHNFDRSPAAVAAAWCGQLEPGELATLERVTEEVREVLERTQLNLG